MGGPGECDLGRVVVFPSRSFLTLFRSLQVFSWTCDGGFGCFAFPKRCKTHIWADQKSVKKVGERKKGDILATTGTALTQTASTRTHVQTAPHGPRLPALTFQGPRHPDRSHRTDPTRTLPFSPLLPLPLTPSPRPGAKTLIPV